MPERITKTPSFQPIWCHAKWCLQRSSYRIVTKEESKSATEYKTCMRKARPPCRNAKIILGLFTTLSEFGLHHENIQCELKTM